MNKFEERVKASPATRRLAKTLGIDLSEIKGTGFGGRVEADDLERYLQEKKIKLNSDPENFMASPKEEFDELKELEESINRINTEIKTLDDRKVEVVNEPEETEDSVEADKDIIKFMIKHQNDLFSDDDVPESVIINYDRAHNTITSDEDLEDWEKDAVVNPTEKDRIYETNIEATMEEAKVEPEQFVPVEENLISREYVEVEKEEEAPEETYDEFEDENRIVLTFNDATNNTIILNTEDNFDVTDRDSSHLVIETKRFNVLNMGISANLGYVREMLSPFVEPTDDMIFDTVVKAIVFAIEKIGIENYHDEMIVGKYIDDVLIKKKIRAIGDLTVTQMDRKMEDITEEDDIIYTVTDITPLGIDYFFPRTGTDTIDFFVLINGDRVKVYLSVCDVILNDVTIAKVLTTVRSVINNPSLMLV